MNGRVLLELAVVAEVEPGVPGVFDTSVFPTDEHTSEAACGLYPWHVEEEDARAALGAIAKARSPKTPTSAEMRFMNPFDRRGFPKTHEIVHEPADTAQLLTSPMQSLHQVPE